MNPRRKMQPARIRWAMKKPATSRGLVSGCASCRGAAAAEGIWLIAVSLARQLLVLGLAAEKHRDEAEHGKPGHDPRGIGQPAELHDKQPGDQRPEAGENPTEPVAERHRGRADMGR